MWEFLITSWCGLRGNLYPIWAQKMFVSALFYKNYMWFFWDLGFTLFDVPKDVVFLEMLVLSNIFDFPAVNWAPKWTKTVKFDCIPFDPKFELSRDFSNTVFVLLEDYLWLKYQQDRPISGWVRPKTLKRGPFHGCWFNTKN